VDVYNDLGRVTCRVTVRVEDVPVRTRYVPRLAQTSVPRGSGRHVGPAVESRRHARHRQSRVGARAPSRARLSTAFQDDLSWKDCLSLRVSARAGG
jgi:hypothetical protein